MLQSFDHPRLGEIILSQTRRSRRVSLSVHPSGRIRLSFPPYISLKRALAFLESKVDWVEATLQKYKNRPSTPKPTSEQIEALRLKAKSYLPARLEELSQITGLKYNKVTIRAARTKWGSCTGQNNISLSLYLMTLPKHLIDYYSCMNCATPYTTTIRPNSTPCWTKSWVARRKFSPKS